jgi:hypothetical protein
VLLGVRTKAYQVKALFADGDLLGNKVPDVLRPVDHFAPSQAATSVPE